MESAEGQAIYRRRMVIELVRAQQKNQALDRFNVRNLVKAKALDLWHAQLAQNLLAARRLSTAIT